VNNKKKKSVRPLFKPHMIQTVPKYFWNKLWSNGFV